MLDHHSKTWKPGNVLRAAKAPPLYIFKNNTTDGVYQRTRSHRRPDTTSSCAHNPTPVQVPTAVTRSPSPPRDVEPPASADDQPPDPRSPARFELHPEKSGLYSPRSGQTVKPPDKLSIKTSAIVSRYRVNLARTGHLKSAIVPRYS